MDELTKSLEAIDRLGISRDAVQMCVLSAIDPPSVTLQADEFRRVFAGKVAESSVTSGGWDRYDIAVDGVGFCCVRRELNPTPSKKVVV